MPSNNFVPKKPVCEVITLGKLNDLMKQLDPDPRTKALACFLYLSACRVSEALMHSPEKLVETEHRGQEVLLFDNLYTLKNRRYKYRPVPAIIDKPELMEMKEYLLSYSDAIQNTMEEYGVVSKKLFPNFSRQSAYNRLAKRIKFKVPAFKFHKGKAPTLINEYQTSLNPHYLRHCRLTHLVQDYGYDSDRLMRLAGWTDPKQALVYVRMDWRDLAKPVAITNAYKLNKELNMA